MVKAMELKTQNNLPPFDAIVAAMKEDTEAMDKLIRFYQPYIRKLATTELYDATGHVHSAVDEQLCRQLESKLIASILKFKFGSHIGCGLSCKYSFSVDPPTSLSFT